MRILDINGNEIESPDLDKGRLERETIFIAHHDAVEEVAEEGHWETIKEYPNGGKDVDWIVDIPGVEAKGPWDEYEDIYRYIEFTEEDLAFYEECKKSVWDHMAEAMREGVNSI